MSLTDFEAIRIFHFLCYYFISEFFFSPCINSVLLKTLQPNFFFSKQGQVIIPIQYSLELYEMHSIHTNIHLLIIYNEMVSIQCSMFLSILTFCFGKTLRFIQHDFWYFVVVALPSKFFNVLHKWILIKIKKVEILFDGILELRHIETDGLPRRDGKWRACNFCFQFKLMNEAENIQSFMLFVLFVCFNIVHLKDREIKNRKQNKCKILYEIKNYIKLNSTRWPRC